MGVAYAIVGCKLPKKVWVKVNERGCTCKGDLPADACFCPKCGAKAHKTREVVDPRLHKNEDELQDCFIQQDCDVYYAVVKVQAGEYDPCKQPLSIPVDARHQAQQFLEPLGLWKDSSFGLYAVLDCG